MVNKEEIKKIISERYENKSKAYLFIIWGYFFGTSLLISLACFIHGGIFIIIIGIMIVIVSFMGCELLHEKTKEYLN